MVQKKLKYLNLSGGTILKKTTLYLHIGQTHPEICVIDQTLISKLLNLPTEKVKCILDGDKQCTYVVPDTANITPSEEFS